MSVLYKKISFATYGDERGNMVVIENNKNIPFDMKRLFYIYGTDSEIKRGMHANRFSNFVLINVAGTSKVYISNGKNEEIVTLDKPNEGVFIPKMVWKEMFDFSKDSVLLCISNEFYNSDEYIRDYDEFCKEMNCR